MKIFGISPVKYEQNRLKIIRNLRIISGSFTAIAILPIIIYLMFWTGIINATSPFSDDIQQPVAKVNAKTATGTAFLVSPTKMLTARHVVEQLGVGKFVEVTFERLPNPITLSAKIIYIAPTNVQVDRSNPSASVPIEYFLTDFAVLELERPVEIVPLILGESDGIAPLDEVVLIGYPGGDYSITKGNINNDKFQNLDLFKLDATSNPGNSGGPCILKADNTVIGVLVGGSGPNVQGENISTKITSIKKALTKAKIDIDK